MKEFTGKTAVITGAAEGIGKVLAKRAFAEGMNVVLADIEKAPLEATLKEMGGDPKRVLSVLMDVSKPEDVERLAREAVAAFGTVDLLVNNAGVGAGGSCWESTMKDWTWVMGINLWGVIYGVRTFVPIMLKQGTPCHIVNTSSIAGLIKGHHSSSYATTKHAVVGLSEQLAVDLERREAKIGVSILCPAWVKTRINECYRNRPSELMNPQDANPVMTPEREQVLKADKTAPAAETMAGPVFDAIRENKLYIVPHKDFVQYIKSRFDGVLKEV